MTPGMAGVEAPIEAVFGFIIPALERLLANLLFDDVASAYSGKVERRSSSEMSSSGCMIFVPVVCKTRATALGAAEEEDGWWEPLLLLDVGNRPTPPTARLGLDVAPVIELTLGPLGAAIAGLGGTGITGTDEPI